MIKILGQDGAKFLEIPIEIDANDEFLGQTSGSIPYLFEPKHAILESEVLKYKGAYNSGKIITNSNGIFARDNLQITEMNDCNRSMVPRFKGFGTIETYTYPLLRIIKKAEEKDEPINLEEFIRQYKQGLGYNNQQQTLLNPYVALIKEILQSCRLLLMQQY